MKAVAAFAVMAGLSGCSEAVPTRIDGSSPEAFARTTAQAREDLPAADRLTFDAAIATMPARRYAEHDPAARARSAFDGMTAADVVATETNRMKGFDQ
jgi:hypothetical protein